MELPPATKHEKIKLTEINQYLTCYLCKGYLIDATTISECLHSFCRSCIIKFLQDNSYCPVCELIINKAKPNLKLDKTLQDIVYKLVPELFLKEMLRRKKFYKDYPQIAARVSPEERGEDTERTIFNPQELISLSLEYICDDSAPGAIRIPGIAMDPETLKNNGSVDESQDSQMKRYLLCPGMCRIEVLKKFVRNKYNVDTSQFFIDLLYKRVPLPDHYTLIDIAYIYSWQRNELMKFFFRIIDINKAKRTESPENNVPKFLPRQFRRTKGNGERAGVSKRKENMSDRKYHRKSVGKVSNGAAKQSSQNGSKNLVETSNGEIKSGLNNDSKVYKAETEGGGIDNRTHGSVNEKSETISEKVMNDNGPEISDSKDKGTNETDKGLKVERCKTVAKHDESIYNFDESENEPVYVRVNKGKLDKENIKNSEVPIEKTCDLSEKECSLKKTKNELNKIIGNDLNETPCVASDIIVKSEPIKTEIKSEQALTPHIKQEPFSRDNTEGQLIFKVSKDFLKESDAISSKAQSFSKPVTKSYTSITLNRSENVEIITKIEPVSNRDGRAIGHHIIKQTIKKGQKLKPNSPKKITGKMGQITIPRLVISKKTIKKKASPKQAVSPTPNDSSEASTSRESVHESSSQQNNENNSNVPSNCPVDVEDEKSKFLKFIDLTPSCNVQKTDSDQSAIPPNQPPKKQLIISRIPASQKRKSNSPLKNCKAKVPKVEYRKPVKIILQEKPSTSKASESLSGATGIKRDKGLQSLINSCKIPSSLSITIKESSDNERSSPVAPPVKNYIEILKLPDDSSGNNDKEATQCSDDNSKELPKPTLNKFCDNDSEQKVDQDLSEIAKSLTEKIPLSTTVSQIVGPKQQFQIPVKTNIPQQFQIQPAPVPDLNKALNMAMPSKDHLGKLNPRSPQTFQKIFEESLRKPAETIKSSTVEVTESDQNANSSTNKRNILEIASQLFKKTKLAQEKSQLEVKKDEVLLPKVPIPRLPNSRTQKTCLTKFEPDQLNKLVPQTVASLHSSSLGLNYTVSVGQKSPSKSTKVNGIVSPVKAESVPKVPECKSSVSPINEVKSIASDFKVPSPSIGSPKLPVASTGNSSSPKPKTPSPKHSPKSSPLVKHMYAPTVPVFNQKIVSPMTRFASLSPKPATGNKTPPRLLNISPKPANISPKPSNSTPTPGTSAPNGNAAGLSPNEIIEKYNIQNLAQLTANYNINPSLIANNQLAALQHAMLLKHFELQNRHNWLNRNQAPLMQYEKYLQSLNGSQSNS